jgi:hypothetical protein
VNQEDLYRFLANTKELLNELQAGHATSRTLTEELIADHASMVTLQAELKALINDVRSKLLGNYVEGVAALAIGSTNTAVSTAAFDYMIGGKRYSKAAVANGTAPGNDVIPQSLFGAVALDIGADGTLDAIEAPANATGYASAVLAVAALPAAAAGHARVGWLTATKSDGAFTFGTTALDAANTTVAYTDASTLANSIGAAVAASPPAALSATSPAVLTNATALKLTP